MFNNEMLKHFLRYLLIIFIWDTKYISLISMSQVNKMQSSNNNKMF